MIKSRNFLTSIAKTGLALGASLALAASCAAPSQSRTAVEPASEAQERPNIVFILIDDMGWKDVGYAGSEFYETPEIDRLASEGVRFDNAHVAYPRCVPSRFALMTGNNPARAQVPGGAGGEAMAPSEFTIAEALKQGGYATFFLGKWHLGKTMEAWPKAQGFDVNIGGGAAGGVKSHFFPYAGDKQLGPGLEQGEKGEYLTDRLTDEAIKLIEQHEASNPDQPFFTYLSHYSVHTPLESKKELREHFEAKLARMGGPKADGTLQRDGETKKYQDNPVYAGMIASIDESVGRIRAALARLGIADETIIVFTSDHGGLSNRGAGSSRDLATSNLPLRAGKGHVYDGGTRVPMIVYWPGKTQPGLVSTSFTTNTDHYAALLEMAGLPTPPQRGVDSVSYVDFLDGTAAEQNRATYVYNSRPRPSQTGDTASAAIRIGDWKFVRNYDPSKTDELFNLANDPGELTNLASVHPDRAKMMRERLDQWLLSVDAVEPQFKRADRAQKRAQRAERQRQRQAQETRKRQQEK